MVKKIIKIWGKGKLKFSKKNKYYEQKNLQLNINKSKKKLSWRPKLSIFESATHFFLRFMDLEKNV